LEEKFTSIKKGDKPMTSLEKLREKEGFYEGYPLSNLTALGLGGKAKYFFLPETYEDLQDAYLYFKQEGIPVKIIGSGSNILVSENGVDAAVFNLKRLPRELHKYSNFVHCSANNPISSVLMFCEKVKLAGLEFLVGVPATIGGAVMMNAGAFSHSIGELVENIEVLLEDGTICTINKKQLQFSYRTSSLEGKIILSVDLRLERSYYRAIRRVKKKKLAYRNAHHPVNEPNLGSVFKNPEDEKAGRLIEEAG